MGGSLELIGAVDVVFHHQLECGATEQLRQDVLSDGSLLQDNHSILISNLKKTCSTVLPGLMMEMATHIKLYISLNPIHKLGNIM